jgi:nucleoside-diphosphate-sugar epimerase
MSNHRTIAVTGANGFLGSHLVNTLVNNSCNVVALVRHIPKLQQQKNIKFRAYDITKTIQPDMLKGVDVVIHAAYLKYDRNNPRAFEQNIEGAKNLLAVAKASGVKHCIFISSMSSHSEAESVYGKQKYAIEELFRQYGGIIVRPGLIIGNGGIVKQMVSFMRSKHIVPLIGGGGQPVQIISIKNLTEAIFKLLSLPQANQTYTLATTKVYTYKYLYRAISEQFKIKVFFVPVPFTLLLLLVKVLSYLPLPLAINSDNVLGLKKLRAVDNKKDIKTIGVKLDTLEEALKNSGL